MKAVFAGLLISSLALPGAALATASVGDPAPAFGAQDVNGKPVQLADFKGRTVVIEWVNPGCPYVQKHYGAGNMQATQKSAADKGVVWLTVNSTNPDHQDYLPPARMASWMKEQRASANSTLMDPDGRVARAYGARTTPHMYVIDTRGIVVYAGAIDSKPSSRASDIPGATNYVTQALSESLAGKPVAVSSTRAYGCSVKYGNGA